MQASQHEEFGGIGKSGRLHKRKIVERQVQAGGAEAAVGARPRGGVALVLRAAIDPGLKQSGAAHFVGH